MYVPEGTAPGPAGGEVLSGAAGQMWVGLGGGRP